MTRKWHWFYLLVVNRNSWRQHGQFLCAFFFILFVFFTVFKHIFFLRYNWRWFAKKNVFSQITHTFLSIILLNCIVPCTSECRLVSVEIDSPLHNHCRQEKLGETKWNWWKCIKWPFVRYIWLQNIPICILCVIVLLLVHLYATASFSCVECSCLPANGQCYTSTMEQRSFLFLIINDHNRFSVWLITIKNFHSIDRCRNDLAYFFLDRLISTAPFIFCIHCVYVKTVILCENTCSKVSKSPNDCIKCSWQQ